MRPISGPANILSSVSSGPSTIVSWKNSKCAVSTPFASQREVNTFRLHFSSKPSPATTSYRFTGRPQPYPERFSFNSVPEFKSEYITPSGNPILECVKDDRRRVLSFP